MSSQFHSTPPPSPSHDPMGVELAQVHSLFEALGVGPIVVDDNGCFVMSDGGDTSLFFQIVPGAGLLKLAVSVCSLDAHAKVSHLRVVRQANP